MKGVCSKWKEFAPHGSKFFPYGIDRPLFRRELVYSKAKQEVTKKVVSLVKYWGKSAKRINSFYYIFSSDLLRFVIEL